MSARPAEATASSPAAGTAFRYRGLNHLALTSGDMTRTIAFYRDVLGMPLVKTIDFPGGRGKHYFFAIGEGATLAFFEFPGGPAGTDVKERDRLGSTPGQMHHVAIDVAPEDIEDYRERLVAAGVEVTDVVNHDDSETGASPDVNETTFVRSIYFRDPDGTILEFAAWTRPLGDGDVREDLRS